MQDTKVETPVVVEGGSTPAVPETPATIEGGVTTRRGTKTHKSRSRSRSKRCPKGSRKETRKGRTNKCRSKSSKRRSYRKHSSKSRALKGVRKLYRSKRCPNGEMKDRRIAKHRNPSGCRKKMSGGSVADAIAQAVAAPAVVTEVQA